MPIHPRDVRGMPPVNGEHGIVPVHTRDGGPGDRNRFNPGGRDLKVLDSPPKDFRKPFNPSLTRADAPRMEGHMIRGGETLGSGPREGQDRSGAHAARGSNESGSTDSIGRRGGDRGG